MGGKKKSRYIFGAALIFMLVSIGAYAYTLFAIDRMRLETAHVRGEIERREHAAIHAQTAHGSVRNTEAERAELASYFIREEGAVSFLEAVEALAREAGIAAEVAGVSIEGVRAVAGESSDEEEAEADPGAVLRLNLGVEGAFPDLFYLLSLLEQLPYAVHMEQFGVERAGDGDVWRGAWSIRAVAKK